MNIVDEMHAITTALTKANITYAICGGLAVTIHGVVRTTKDVDVLVAAEDVARVLESVRSIGYEFAALPMIFDEGTDRARHVQRVSKIRGAEHVVLDLLVADGPCAGMLDDRVELDLPEGKLCVVSRRTLLAMKRMANRPQDLADIEKLEELE